MPWGPVGSRGNDWAYPWYTVGPGKLWFSATIGITHGIAGDPAGTIGIAHGISWNPAGTIGITHDIHRGMLQELLLRYIMGPVVRPSGSPTGSRESPKGSRRFPREFQVSDGKSQSSSKCQTLKRGEG